MKLKQALELALAQLGPFAESSLYEDYKAEDGFTDAEWDAMMDTLREAARNTRDGYKAHFEPQAWINDNAVSVDPEGEEWWNATAFINADPALKAKVDKGIASDEAFLDLDDVLMGDDNAPEWVKNWQGPFTITVVAVQISEA
jgi:hypothetical protein